MYRSSLNPLDHHRAGRTLTTGAMHRAPMLRKMTIPAMAVAALMAATPVAKAAAPMPGPPKTSGVVSETPGGNQGSTISDGKPSVPPVKQQETVPQRRPPRRPRQGLGTRLRPGSLSRAGRHDAVKTNRRRTRTCRYLRGKTLTKICTKRRGRRQRCRHISSASAVEPARQISNAAISRARATAKIAGYLGSGWVNPVSRGHRPLLRQRQRLVLRNNARAWDRAHRGALSLGYRRGPPDQPDPLPSRTALCRSFPATGRSTVQTRPHMASGMSP